jgi:hypothetical protein
VRRRSRWRTDAGRPDLPCENAVDRFHRERRADGVDVLAARNSASLRAAGTHDYVDEEGLRGLTALVDRGRCRRVRSRHVFGRIDRHVRTHLRDRQMAGMVTSSAMVNSPMTVRVPIAPTSSSPP